MPQFVFAVYRNNETNNIRTQFRVDYHERPKSGSKEDERVVLMYHSAPLQTASPDKLRGTFEHFATQIVAAGLQFQDDEYTAKQHSTKVVDARTEAVKALALAREFGHEAFEAFEQGRTL